METTAGTVDVEDVGGTNGSDTTPGTNDMEMTGGSTTVENTGGINDAAPTGGSTTVENTGGMNDAAPTGGTIALENTAGTSTVEAVGGANETEAATDLCADVECGLHAQCANGECQCNPGYVLDGEDDCIDINECAEHNGDCGVRRGRKGQGGGRARAQDVRGL